MRRTSTPFRIGQISLFALAMHGAAALAQDAAAAADVADEELVVTARKRAENVQDVPDSISVLSARMIEQAGIRSVDDASALIPNLSLVDSQDSGNVAISVRGIGQVRNGEAPVALVVDGVQLNSTDMIKQALFDLERIEVLKGPQGALYGRNAIGGAIVITTRMPTDTVEGRVSAEYANGDDRRLMGAISGPLIADKLLFRIAADYRDFDGVFENVTLDRKVDFVEDLNVRSRLLFKPTDALTIDLRGAFGDLEGGASWYIPLPPNSPNDTKTPIQADVLGRSVRDNREGSLKIDYDTGPVTITSTTAVADTKVDLVEDLDWLPQSILGATQGRDYSTVTQELRLASPSNQRFRWTVGTYYLDGKRKVDTVLLLSPDATATGLPLSSYAPLPVTRSTEDIQTKAGYAQLSYDLLPELEITAALRYDHDKRKQRDRLVPGSARREASFEEWQPKLSVKYDLSDDSMVYATAARGFRSGGFNSPSGTFPEVYKPETTTNYEVGTKNSLLDRRLTLNASAFYIEYKDQQVFLLRVAEQGIINIADTKILGFEAEMQARPTDRLELGASLGLIDSEIKNFDGTDTFRGNKVPLTYKWSYVLSGQYTVPLGDAALAARLEYSGKGGNYWHVDNRAKQDDVHLVDARLTWTRDRLSVAGFVDNLFDVEYTEEFFAKEFSAGFTDIRYPGMPRRYGVNVTYKF